MVGLGLTGGSMYFISENYALQYTLANNVSFIVAASPLITTLLALAFTKGMKATKSLIFGSVLALVGVAIVIFFGKAGCGFILLFRSLLPDAEEVQQPLRPCVYHA